jgi:hypothetical protein
MIFIGGFALITIDRSVSNVLAVIGTFQYYVPFCFLLQMVYHFVQYHTTEYNKTTRNVDPIQIVAKKSYSTQNPRGNVQSVSV